MPSTTSVDDERIDTNENSGIERRALVIDKRSASARRRDIVPAGPPLDRSGSSSMCSQRTLPVERKYCARATTNSCAGTSLTVLGAFLVAMFLRDAARKGGSARDVANLADVGFD